MATRHMPQVPIGEPGGTANAAMQRQWRMRSLLSRTGDGVEAFLGKSGFDRGPWLTVALAAGIGSWFALEQRWQWLGAIGAAVMLALAGQALWRGVDRRAGLRLAVGALGIAFALGLSLIWIRSEMIGAEPLPHPQMMAMDARILAREEQPAQGRVRLELATRHADDGRAIKVRVNVPANRDVAGAQEGARVRLKARLMPPSPPLLPGAYDFARAAWFKGYAATGSLVGEIEVLEPASRGDAWLARAQRRISAHVRGNLDGSAGSIAAAFASGDRGAISEADEVAMRDAGLTHLLSISGLHVSAVIAAAYFIAIRLLALWPWLTLRVRLPLLAAGIAAAAGIGYTLLTGAEVPTVRSCIGAVLVLVALAMGREPLSLRMVAVAAAVVLFLWPETLVGPSFQMSFAAVIAIIALHNAGPVRDFLAPREESSLRRMARRVIMLFITGIVIEAALTPIVLFHFHRAGLYGAIANVFAIPLVTFIAMPLIALALLLDLVGAGTPVWWLAGQSLDLMLWIAHLTAAQPGAVKLMPHMGTGTFLLFVGGCLWTALWRGRVRLWGMVPVTVGSILLALAVTPDLLITRDGRDLGIVDEDGRLFVLRDSEGGYAQENLLQLSGVEAEPLPIEQWPGARCNADFCVIPITKPDRRWFVLVSRSRERIDELALAAACEQSDIVVADRWLPRSCRPRWLKADRRFLDQNGGTSVFLNKERIDTVASGQGDHGWWHTAER